jgi:2-oxoglutarate ferredoxin oxidoreductase subunit alpha
MLVAEMSAGQMLEDVQLATEGRCPIHFFGRMGGVIPLPDEILAALNDIITDRQAGATAESGRAK